MISLETLDSFTWTIGCILISGKSMLVDDLINCSLLLGLMTLSWLVQIFERRPLFRNGAAPQIVGGLPAIPTALISLGSKFVPLSFTLTFTFGALFLLSRKTVPTTDYKFSIPLTIIIPFLLYLILDESIVVLLLGNIFGIFVIHVLLIYSKGSFSIGEGMLVSTLSSLSIRSIIIESELSQFCGAFIAGSIFCLCLSMKYRTPIVVFSLLIPFYFLFTNLSVIISFVFSIKHIIILIYCGVVCVIFILGSIFWKGLEKLPQIVQRKFFHIMALLVFIVPVYYDVQWMRLAISGAIFVFLAVESLRLVRFPFIAKIIEQYVSGFLDEKDSGELILTHLFLLLGCGLPVMFCDYTGFLGLAVRVCGISVLAIGDAAASAIGVKYGKHKWPGSKKSIEGTIGAFIGTWITIVILTCIGERTFDFLSVFILFIPSLVGALDEAFTSQIDNLTLPFVILPHVVLSLQLVQ